MFRKVQSGYMCDMNIVAMTYYHGGMLVDTTTTIDNTTRTVRLMAEAQRDAYEALTENLAAAQRRSIGLANDGLEFMRLQEESARAAQEWFANGVRLLQLQQRNAEFVQGWTSDAVEALGEQTDHNVRTAEAFAQVVSKQQEGLRALTQGWTGAYREFFSPIAYAREGLRSVQRATQQGLEATQQVARQGLQATEEVAQQGLRVAEEVTEQSAEVLRQTEKATRQAELEVAVFGALKTTNYEEMTVDEISKRLEGLSADELKKVREYEKQNKDRETLIEQIERKIRANS
jgi:hypothetical protein